MAAEFLKTHGIDLDSELAQIQNPAAARSNLQSQESTQPAITHIHNATLPQTAPRSHWNIAIHNSRISSMTPLSPSHPTPPAHSLNGKGALLTPSLCHPHIHIDKAYLLSHPKYSHLPIQKGDFKEAMDLTGHAKAQFEQWDLLERGQRVVDESVRAGVTHMRAFVEVDAGVGVKCLDAGLKLKRRAEKERRMKVQVCAFAQLPLFSPSGGDEDGAVIRGLMEEAAGKREGVDVVGSTPYVENERVNMERNVEWMIELSLKCGKHLDFHLDYHVDPAVEPMVWYVVRMLKEKKWKEGNPGKTVVLGHCTRLTLFSSEEWEELREEIGELPVSFVGLPNSDLFMMRTPEKSRGTLNVVEMIREHGLNACLGINNIGNAFTPHGSCDPLTLACNGVGVYQAGTERDAQVLFECVSTRAKRAIGFADEEREGLDENGLEVKEGDTANLLLFGGEGEEWRTRKSVAEAVYLYDSVNGRRGFLEGVQQTRYDARVSKQDERVGEDETV